MHELGIVIEIVKQIETYMTENHIPEVASLVLQIGALSSVYPKFIEDVYPIAVEKTKLRNTKLIIEVTPGIGQCKNCTLAYDLIQSDHICPKCRASDFQVISGKDFMIKEIHVANE